MTSKEYEYIIKQQKEIIKQQKELIDSLLANRVAIPRDKDSAPKEVDRIFYDPFYPKITCSDILYCTEAPMDENKIYTSYSTTSASNSDKPVVVDLEGKVPDEFNIYEEK